MVVNIAVGRQGWLGNSLKLLGQIGCWPSQSLVVTPRPFHPPNHALPHLTALSLASLQHAPWQTTKSTIQPALRMHHTDQDVQVKPKMQQEVSISRQTCHYYPCPLDSGNTGDFSCPHLPVQVVQVYVQYHTYTDTYTLKVCQPGACCHR